MMFWTENERSRGVSEEVNYLLLLENIKTNLKDYISLFWEPFNTYPLTVVDILRKAAGSSVGDGRIPQGA